MKMNNSVKRFAGNSGWMMGQQIYNMLIQLIVGSLSARYLGPSNYGLINYGASIISFFTIISRLGLDSVIINEMIKTPEKRGKYLGSAIVMRLMTSIVSLFVVMGIIRILEPGNTELYIITLLQSFAIILQVYEVFNYWFQLNLRMKYVSIATMIAQTCVAIWRITLLATHATVYWFALSASIQYLVCGIVVFYFFTKEKNIDFRMKFERTDALFLLRNSYHFIIAGIAITFYMQIDKVMIGHYLNSTEVGIYTAAVTIAALWEFIPNALVNSARPIIIEKRKNDYAAYIKYFRLLLLGISILSVVVSIGMMVLGRLAIMILYGANYLGAVYPLWILIWSTGFAMIGTTRTIWLVAEGYNKYSKYLVLIGAVTNFMLNMVAIRIWGITGAAMTTFVSQFVVAFIAPAWFKDTRPFVKLYLSSIGQIPYLYSYMKSRAKKKS